MPDLESVSRVLQESLTLKYAPVGVTLYDDFDALPTNVTFSQETYKSYCQALVLAGEGRTFLLNRDMMGCKLGTSVLGFEHDTETYLDDGILEKFGVGLFATEAASAKTIRGATCLEKGKTIAALIAPLSVFREMPQVVVFTADSEQVMWLLYAVNHETGGSMTLPQSGGALGGCADITALPLLGGITNVTFLGLGCRIKSAIAPCHLMLGMPGSVLPAVHRAVVKMAKPIGMLNSSRTSP